MIENESSSIAYSGNASATTPYIVNFPFLDPAHIVVIATTAAGVSTTLVSGTDYTLSSTIASDGTSYTGGSVTTVTAYAATYTITVKRVTPVLQPTEYSEAGPFPAASHETALDRLTLIAQETRRDSSPGTSDITVSGTGIVAQTVEGTFAARTISPTAASGLTVTNGDGVAGNPTIVVDLSERAVVTSLADSDLVPVRASSVESVISSANLRAGMATGSYGTVSYGAALIVPDQTTPCTVGTINHTIGSDTIATFPNSSTPTGFLRIILPGDYSGGEILMKLHQYDGASGVISGDVVWQIRKAISADRAASLDTLTGSYLEYTEDQWLGLNYYIESSPISLGTGYSPGDVMQIEILRDPAHVDDARAYTVGIVAVEIQYPRVLVSAAWA